MKRILITGGAGFVGRRFVRRFLLAGHEVVCVDSLAAGTGGIAPAAGWPLFEPRDFAAFHFLQQDCRDYFRQHPTDQFDEVYHLAAMVGGRLMIERQPLLVADDLSIDACYWQWAATARPKKSIIFSSSAAYPIQHQRREGYRLLSESMIDFTHTLGMPDMTYGWAKLTMEYVTRLAYEKHGLESVCYRPFSGYGEDQDETYPFPSICKRALEHRGASRLQVWGSGQQMRDFIHIEDCVDGVLKTKEQISNGRAINLSTGLFTSFIQLATQVAEVIGYSPEVMGVADKPEGVFARGGDTALQKSFGFLPVVSLKRGIEMSLAYFEQLFKTLPANNEAELPKAIVRKARAGHP
jgi:nucleoside-diphosphate-sugar epimerase